MLDDISEEFVPIVLVYLGIRLTRNRVRQYAYYPEDQIPEDAEHFSPNPIKELWFKKPLYSGYPGLMINAKVSSTGISFRGPYTYAGFYKNSKLVEQWQAEHRANEVLKSQGKQAKNDLLEEHIKVLRKMVEGMSYEQRRAFIAYLLERLL